MSQEPQIIQRHRQLGVYDPELGFVPLIAGGALGTDPMTPTTHATYIPEVWLDELRAFREKNLVLATMVKRVPFEGQVGDTLHIPDLGRLTAANVTAGVEVTPAVETPSEFTGTITRHRAVPFQVADITGLQSKYNLRSAYTQGSGKVIVEDIDSHIWSLESGFQGGNRKIGSGNTNWSAATSGNGADITAAGLRALIEILDLVDVPLDGRAMVNNPRQKAVLLAIDKFTEYQMLGPGMIPIRTGLVGELYGIPMFFSTNGPTVNSSDSTTFDIGLLLQRDAILLAMQMDVRIQAQYKLEFLSWLVIIDYIGQAFEFRDDHAVAVVTSQ